MSMSYFLSIKNNIVMLIEKQAKTALITKSIFKITETKSPIKYEIKYVRGEMSLIFLNLDDINGRKDMDMTNNIMN